MTWYYTVFSHFFFLYSMRFSTFFDFIFLAHSHKRIRLHAQLQHAFGRLFSCCHNFGFAAAAAVKSIPCLGCCIVYLSATVHFRCLSAAYGNAKQVPDSIMCGHETWSMYSNWMATKSAEWEWKRRIVNEGEREMWERSVRGCRLSCSSRSSWLKISAPSRILSVSLCSHRLRPSVVDHLHNTHFQWVIAIHDWAHYLRHTITLAAGPLTSLNSADYVCMLRCPHSKLGTANI